MTRTPTRNRLEFLLYLAAKKFVLTLSHRGAQRFGRGLGAVGHRVFGRHVRLAENNIALTMPSLDEEERRAVVRRCFRHFGTAFCEAVSASRFSPDEIKGLFEIEGLEHLEAAKAMGRGGLLISGHVGSWQVGAFFLGTLIDGFRVVARPPDNPHIARDVLGVRQRCGVTVLSRHGTGHEIYSIVRRGGFVGMVIDQRAPGNSGIVVPFLDRPGRTLSLPAFVALRNRAPAVPTVTLPLPGGRYSMRFLPPIVGEGRGDEAVADLTRRYMDAIAGQIRQTPEMYLWMHDRWRQ